METPLPSSLSPTGWTTSSTNTNENEFGSSSTSVGETNSYVEETLSASSFPSRFSSAFTENGRKEDPLCMDDLEESIEEQERMWRVIGSPPVSLFSFSSLPSTSLTSSSSEALPSSSSPSERNEPEAAPILPDTYPRAVTPPNMGTLPTNSYLPSHFFRGTAIQLASGDTKNVEDVNTDDFIMCATMTDELKVETSTVILLERNNVIFRISFLVGSMKTRCELEVRPEHPFFVVGYGWSSCDPKKTYERYGLQARHLQVGDVCVSLTSSEMDDMESEKALGRIVGLREAAKAESRDSHLATVAENNRARKRRKDGRMSAPPLLTTVSDVFPSTENCTRYHES